MQFVLFLPKETRPTAHHLQESDGLAGEDEKKEGMFVIGFENDPIWRALNAQMDALAEVTCLLCSCLVMFI